MRFIFAIVCFVLAALMMGLGIGQRTIFAGPDEVTAATTETAASPVTIIDGSALNAYEQAQTVDISGTPTISAAYGRTADVIAWVGDATYTEVSYDETAKELVSTVVTGSETSVPLLAGSDLWLHEYTADSTLHFRASLPTDVSIIAVSDGITPAPSEVSITWPLDNSTPWSGPLVVIGGIFVLLGLVFLVWALTHVRRSRGPRRTQQKLPKMPKLPRPPRYRPSKVRAIAAQRPGSKGRRATRRMVAIVPMAVIGSVLLAGCSIGNWPIQGGTGDSTPTPTSTAAVESEIDPPAVSEAQVTRIMSEIGTVVAQADASKDTALIATRLTGTALELRLANYKIATADATVADVPTPIPPTVLQLIVPQQTTVWPRVVFAVVQAAQDPAVAVDPANPPASPTAVMLVQDDARSNYKVSYAVALAGGSTLPGFSSVDVGSARLSPDFKLLTLTPSEVAAAYADIMVKDTESDYYDLFQADGDALRLSIGLAKQQETINALSTTAKEEFTRTGGSAEVIAMSTAESGAIVAVQMNETDTVTPVKAGALVNVPARLKTLLGKDTTTKGLIATYSDQLLFFVPSANTGGQITLLGNASSLVSVTEVP